MVKPVAALVLLVTAVSLGLPAQGLQENAVIGEGDVTTNSGSRDWLIEPGIFRAKVVESNSDNRIILENGLITREILVKPNVATVSLKNRHGDQLIRAVRPEAKITIDGQAYDVGGLVGQPNHAFLTDKWIAALQPAPQSMQCASYEIGKPVARFDWKRVRHHDKTTAWPPRGVAVRFDYKFPNDSGLDDVRVSVHYELYDGVPTICKWLSIDNMSSSSVTVDRFSSEILALVEKSNPVEFREGIPVPKPDMLHVETDFAFGGFNFENANRHVVHYRADPLYKTQVNWARQSPCLLEVAPDYGPAQTIKPGGSFQSFRTFEVALDSTDRERRGLSLRRNYRTIAPWITENPIMHHLLSSDPKRVKAAIDEAADVGFEMIILSFGSGFNMENDDPEYLNTWKQVADHADSKGIEIGAYSLLSSRRIGGGNDIVSPQGSKPTHGNCPALTSVWGQEYYRKLYAFFDKTGFDLLEHDGPYPGDVDVTARPPLQKGALDSRWVQWRIASRFYEHCRGRGIYLNTPDYYFLNGSNKCGMGYRESNWSLPREQQVIHTRQNIFDGTWTKTPSMGWMFVPLSQYQGGGQAATIEPLQDHLDHYKKMMQCNFALGVQACFRGPRLYDSETTRQLVKSQVAWFKQYREVLEADLIHGRRADGRDIDWMLHVNPGGEHKGMLLVFNPLSKPVTRKMNVPLYYTGLTDSARITVNGIQPANVVLGRDYSAEVEVSVKAESMTWILIEKP